LLKTTIYTLPMSVMALVILEVTESFKDGTTSCAFDFRVLNHCISPLLLR
jgi:hypothetical protein